MTAIQVPDRPASQSFYAVAGRLLFVETLNRDLSRSLARLFAGWQLTPVSFPERTPDVKITFSVCQELPKIPFGFAVTEFDVANGGRMFSAADSFYLKFESCLVHLKPPEGERIDVAVWTKVFPGPNDVEFARAASFAVCAALRRFGLFELHSGGVVVPASDEAVLIVGASGTGKSTLTLQLANAGWGYLSDDELLLGVAGEEVEARGFRSFFALAPAAATVGRHSALKTCFEPASVFAAPAVSRALPRFVLFTSISGDSETRISLLSQTEAMTRLLRACPWATYDNAVAGPYLQLLSRLARQAKGFSLAAGTDLLEPGEASRIIRAACHVWESHSHRAEAR